MSVLRSRLDTTGASTPRTWPACASSGTRWPSSSPPCRPSAASATSIATDAGASCWCVSASRRWSTPTRRSSSSAPWPHGAPRTRWVPASSRHRHRRGHQGRDHRLRHHLPGWLGQPVDAVEAVPLLRDRPGEPAAGHQPERVRRCRPAPPGRHLRARWGAVPHPDPAVEGGHPDHHDRLRSRNRGGRLRAGHERLRGHGEGRRHGLPGWPAAGEDGHRRGDRRGVPGWRGDAQHDQRTVGLPGGRRVGRAAHRPPDRRPPAAPRPAHPTRCRRRAGARRRRADRLRVGRRAGALRGA